MRTLLLVCVLAVAVNVAPAQAPFTWEPKAPPTAPTPRSGHAMAFDSARAVTVLFGGGDQNGPLGDTWEWDGAAWSLKAPSVSPAPRLQHAMAFDPVRGRVVLFGGLGFPFFISSETWEWDGANWQLRPAAFSPGPSTTPSMVFDPLRGRCCLVTGFPSLAAVWEWDGAAWLQQPPGPTGSSGAMAFDTQRGRAVLWGYQEIMMPFSAEVWERAGTTWTSQSVTPRPSDRTGHRMVFDGQRSKCVLFGGGGLADTWEWDGAAWAIQQPLASPPGRSSHAMAYDSIRGRIVLFGGHDGGSSYLGDTWEGGNGTTPATVGVYGSGCGSPALSMVPQSGSRPIIGSTMVSLVDHAYLGIAFVAWGTSNQVWGTIPLPVSLDPVGIQGCQLWQDAQVLSLPCVSTTWNTAQHNLPIPAAPGALGINIYLQAWSLRPGFNSMGVVLSNGVALTIGDI